MLLNTENIDEAVARIKEYSEKHKKDCFICIAAESQIDISNFIKLLNTADVNFVGAVFPSVFNEKGCFHDKILVKFFDFADQLIYIDDLEATPTASFMKIKESKANSLLLFCDPYEANLSPLLIQLFNAFGDKLNMAGACTMVKDNKFDFNIFDANGTYSNKILAIPLIEKTSVSAKHGWIEKTGPYIVTKSRGRLVEHLNWRSATEVFLEALGREDQKEMTPKDFTRLGEDFPFGIYKDFGENIVRDAVLFSDKEGIKFLIEVPENAVMFILEGHKKSLLEASIKSIQESMDISQPIIDQFVISCYRRRLFYGENYLEEIEGICQESMGGKIEGIISLGEIGANENGFLELYNRTCLSLSFYN